jgi:hypothetical protein
MLDIFNDNSFSNLELSAAIQVVPNNYGILQRMNAFPDKPVRTRSIVIERKDGQLNLLPTQPVGGPATQGTSSKRVLRNFTIPHIPYEDVILAADVQGIRAFGSDTQLAAVQDLVLEKLTAAANKHYITREFHKWGALRGTVLDADGSVILDLFDEFGVTEKVIDFAFSSAGTDVAAKVREIKQYVEEQAMGLMYDGIHVFCSPEFFNALVGHQKVEKFYTAFNNGTLLNQDQRSGFPFQGVMFEQISASATDAAGTVRKFVPANTARVFLKGAPGLYATYNAPADFIETVNTPGQVLYASQEVMKHNRGVEIHTQSNPLPLCTRPELLVKLTMS